MTFVSRVEWGAEKPEPSGSIVHPNNRTHFVVHHSTGDNLGHPDPKQWVLNIYNYHVYTQGYQDIGYNFLVDWDGNIYEGRGWDRSGACQYGLNTNGWCVVLLGNSNLPKNASPAALKSIRSLAEEADFRSGKSLIRWGHKDVPNNSSDCPGADLYAWIHAGMPVEEDKPAVPDARLFLVVVKSGFVLGPDAGNAGNGVPVNQWVLHGRPEQVWSISRVGEKGFLITNTASKKLLAADLLPGKRVIQWEYQAGNPAQEWNLERRGEGLVIQQVSTGLEISIGDSPADPAVLVDAGEGSLFVGVWLDG